MTNELSDKPHKLAAVLRNYIEQGGYHAGSQIPSHRKLAVLYGVSVETASKAVQLLIDDGVLVGGQRHEGTHVAFLRVVP
jgi:DNA-binding GntR family transcriptional regulator